ncbi:MAG: hypothetical protein J6D53_11650, partial [Blautia sp.]|nr:hypothetical protein [Blautia sp.]
MYMKRILILSIPILLLLGTLLVLSRHPGVSENEIPPVQMEYLDRGTVAVMTDGGVFLSWRLLGTEDFDTSFLVFRNNQRIAEVADSTNYLDEEGTMDDKYTVLPLSGEDTSSGTNARSGSGVSSGGPVSAHPENVDAQMGTPLTDEKQVSVLPDARLEIPLQIPEGGVSEENETYSYSPNDAACADLDGDGEYEIILKWDPSNSFDSGRPAKHTGNVYIDAYRLDGKMLWRIDLGKNVSAGAHFTQMIAYDFDLDGSAELILKTAPGSLDGAGKYVSLASEIPAIRDADNLADYRGAANASDPTGGRVLSGDEYLTVFDGRTGEAVDTIYYPFPRGSIEEWGDDKGNRSERYLAAAAYLDGVNPHFIAWRGYYAKTAAAAYRLEDRRLVLT